MGGRERGRERETETEERTAAERDRAIGGRVRCPRARLAAVTKFFHSFNGLEIMYE